MGKKSRGLLSGAGNMLWLLIIAGALVGWARANDITSFAQALDYAKSWSNKTSDCYGDTTDDLWKCDDSHGNGGGDVDISPPGEGGGLDASPIKISEGKEELTTKLVTLKTAPPSGVSYNRAEWPHWVGSPCDARERTLKAQGIDVKIDATCRVLSGTWKDPYSNPQIVITDPSRVDIDHMIPLNYAAQHGGQSWPVERKQQFANDPQNLVAASAKENRTKSDRGPSRYMPPNKAFHCAYSAMWIEMASNYGLWLEQADKDTLKRGIESCT
jgi:hypothetical protein